ncbi:MAG: hypothetical protein ACK4P3_07490 [Fimbriimonadaceae bacterium]
MDLRPALCQQYHAALYMLRDCVQQCSDRLWTEGEYPDQFWRSAFHVTFFTQYYLSQTQQEYTPWPGRPAGFLEGMWAATDFENRGELPKDQPYLSKQQMIDFIDFVDSIVDSTIERMDLDAPDSGFDWYPEFPKLPHVLMNLGHVYYHVGQLVQLLLEEGIDVDWNAHVRLEDYGQQTSL